MKFYANKVFDYAQSLYKSPVSSLTFQPKYTNDYNLWTTDKLVIIKKVCVEHQHPKTVKQIEKQGHISSLLKNRGII
jgi:hypothetical protein